MNATRRLVSTNLLVCSAWTLLALASPQAISGQELPRAFVSSVAGPGAFAQWPVADPGLAGLAAADSVCRNLAAQAGLPSPELFVAWLSDDQDDAWCRVQRLQGHRLESCGGAPAPTASGPWARFGESYAWSRALEDLTGSVGPLRPLDRDEHGSLVDPVERVWTGTDGGGSHLDPMLTGSCLGWTSASFEKFALLGAVSATRFGWTDAALATCDQSYRLYCVEAASGPTLAFDEPRPAGLAFVTAATGPADLGGWIPGSGLTGVDAADEICRRSAAAAHLPAADTFLAWISSSTAAAISRIPTGIAYARLDGVRIVADSAELATGSLDAPLNQTETGEYRPAVAGQAPTVWTGTTADGTGVPALTCSDWTSAGGTAEALVGFVNYADATWTDGFQTACSDDLPLYCLSGVEFVFFDSFEAGDTRRWSVPAN